MASRIRGKRSVTAQISGDPKYGLATSHGEAPCRCQMSWTFYIVYLLRYSKYREREEACGERSARSRIPRGNRATVKVKDISQLLYSLILYDLPLCNILYSCAIKCWNKHLCPTCNILLCKFTDYNLGDGIKVMRGESEDGGAGARKTYSEETGVRLRGERGEDAG
jgi:hypothetical protein